MEWHHDNSNVKVPKNIWELGAKRFMGEPGFVMAYIDFQLGLGDTANSRATFERALTVTPHSQARPLWDAYLQFESQVRGACLHRHPWLAWDFRESVLHSWLSMMSAGWLAAPLRVTFTPVKLLRNSLCKLRAGTVPQALIISAWRTSCGYRLALRCTILPIVARCQLC